LTGSGDYRFYLRWLALERSVDAVGGTVRIHQPNGHLWASIDELTGRRQPIAGATQTGVDAEIRVRQFPDVRADDLLQDQGRELVYRVDSVRIGENELILDVFRLDSLADYTIEEGS
jgi:head-tail adaptor